MKILNAEVNMMENWANDPVLELTVSTLPTVDGLVYSRYGECVFAESNGYVNFFYHNGDGLNHKGYGGVTFRVPFKHPGTGAVDMQDFKGPWSGGAYITNTRPGIPTQVLDVTYRVPNKTMGYSGHCTLSVALSALYRFCPGFDLYVDEREEHYFCDGLMRTFRPYPTHLGPKSPRPTDTFDYSRWL